MIVKPDTPLIFCNQDEDGTGAYIGDVRLYRVDSEEAVVHIPLKDFPQLIKRLKEISRELRGGVEEPAEAE